MASATETLRLIISGDSSQAVSAFKTLEDQSSKSNKILGMTPGVATAVGAGLTAMGVAAGAAISKVTSSAVDYATQVSNVQRLTGLSAEESSKFAAVLSRYGVEGKKVGVVIKTLSTNIAGHSQELAKAGIATQNADGSNRSSMAVMRDLADYYSKAKDKTEAVALASKVLGRGYMDLLPVLAGGGAAIDKVTASAERNGMILSQGQVDAVRKFKAAQADLQETRRGTEIQMGLLTLPFEKFKTESVGGLAKALNTLPEPFKFAVAAGLELGQGLGTIGGPLMMMIANLPQLIAFIGTVATQGWLAAAGIAAEGEAAAAATPELQGLAAAEAEASGGASAVAAAGGAGAGGAAAGGATGLWGWFLGLGTAVAGAWAAFAAGGGVFASVGAVFGGLGAGVAAIGTGLVAAAGAVGFLIGSLINMIPWVHDAQVALGNWIAQTFMMPDSFAKLGSAIGGFFSGLPAMFANVGSSISAALMAAWNSFISWLGSLHIPTPRFGITGGFSLNPPSVPAFSVGWAGSGGTFDAPTIIGVGERGTEHVLREDQIASIVRGASGGLSLSGGITVNVNGGDASTGPAVRDAVLGALRDLDRERRR